MMMNNISESTNDSSTEQLPLSKILEQYIKYPNGAIFQVMAHPKKVGKVLLYSKNKYLEIDFLKVKNGLVKKEYFPINEHEYRKHVKEEELYQQEFSYRLVKRILYTQLLIELDDELKQDFSDDKYVLGLLERCEKQFERLVKEQFARFYNIDKQITNNFLKQIELFVSKVSKVRIDTFFDLNEMMDQYLADPNKFKLDVVYLDKVDAE